MNSPTLVVHGTLSRQAGAFRTLLPQH